MQTTLPILPLLTTLEACALLQVSHYTMRRWRLDGKGPAFIKIGSNVRYTHTCIQTYLDQQRRTCTAQTESPGAV